MINHRSAVIFGGAAIVVSLLWIAKSRGLATIPSFALPVQNVPMAYQQTTPGVLIPNQNFSQALPQQQNFTNFNVNVESPALSLLSDKYMPLFGFVGISKGGNDSISALKEYIDARLSVIRNPPIQAQAPNIVRIPAKNIIPLQLKSSPILSDYHRFGFGSTAGILGGSTGGNF